MGTIAEVIAEWMDDPETAERIVQVERIPEHTALTAPLDPAPPASIAERLEALDIHEVYRHQQEAIARIRAGHHTVVAAGTASGKSLAYQIPIAEAVAENPETTAILVFPTKALAQDQYRALVSMGGDATVAATYDGDTPSDDRRWVRRHANAVLTNPDMLHVGILPNHGSWTRFLRGLRYVVIDELHAMRGIFGSHVALVLRRLRRIAARYGADPTFIFTSATIGNPGSLAERLIGEPVTVVDTDTSPSGAKTYVLWNPPIEDEARGVRLSPIAEATRVFCDLVAHDLHTIVFGRSRKASELTYRWARERLDPHHADRIAPYRGGYLAEDRRRIETRLFSGELLGVTATNALELGIDVGGLDAAVITTFPGTIASFRQQAGRSGRSTDESLAVLVAGQDALDQYFMTHPRELFERPSEEVVVNPDNPEILAAHLACAAAEAPLEAADAAFFGPTLDAVLPALFETGVLGMRNGRVHHRGGRSPARHVDIRTAGRPPYDIVDDQSNLLGSIDEGRAFSQCHPGAVYLHQGDTYVVDSLDIERREIRVRPGEVGYYTQPDVDKDIRISTVVDRRPIGRLEAFHGLVEVDSHVVGYRRKSIRTGEVLETAPLDLPPERYTTQAFWYEFPTEVFEDAALAWQDLPGVLHAAEHTAIAMLPIFAVCDRWDVGGLSTPFHLQTGMPVFFIYDGYPGGAGISPIGFAQADRHLAATLDALDRCPCSTGCPSCVQSPKCGNFNEPLDKHGAAAALRTALAPVPRR